MIFPPTETLLESSITGDEDEEAPQGGDKSDGASLDEKREGSPKEDVMEVLQV